jgi:hypothetical protein
MGFFSFIFGRSRENVPPPPILNYDREDHLGKAAAAGASAKNAVAGGRFNDAWRLFHEQKEHYRRHAVRYGMTPRQTIALDGSVHEHLANIQRLEGKHDDALVHMLYCVASNTRPTKAQLKKLPAYFARCKFGAADEKMLNEFVANSSQAPDFAAIQSRVRQWRSGS